MFDPIRISVIIPAYNAAQRIVATIESCLGQSKAPYEIIVVDDGSTDETSDLLRTQFPGQIRLLQGDRNQGPAAARNLGIHAASGTHIAFLDADDIWHPQKLELVARAFSEIPSIQFLFHRFTVNALNYAPRKTYRLPVSKYPFRKLLLRNPVATPCVVIDRRIIEPFNEEMRYMEDYELFLRIAYKHGLFLLNATLTQLGRPVLSKGGQSENKLQMRLGEIRAWVSLCRLAPKYYLLLPVLMPFSFLKHTLKSLK